MELSQIDALLERYLDAEKRITANLVEIDSLPTFKLMVASTMHGATSQRLAEPLSHVDEMWSLLDVLKRTIADAVEIRGTDKRLSGADTARLITLLTKPSVLVNVEATPLGERDLLGTPSRETRVQIEQIINRMRSLYEPIRNAIADVDVVWRDLFPRIDADVATLTRLDNEAQALASKHEPELGQLRRRLDEVRAALADDPLSLNPAAVGPELDRLVAAAASRISGLRRSHDELDEDLAETEPLLAELRMLLARATAALSESHAKVTDASGTVRVPSTASIDGPGGVAEQLDRLLDATDKRPWSERRGLLDHWLTTARRFRDQLQRALDTNARPVRERDELRGLLAAYKVKAAMVGRAEDLALADLADKAHNELFTAPTDLVRTRMLIRQYGEELRKPPGVDGPNGSGSR